MIRKVHRIFCCTIFFSIAVSPELIPAESLGSWLKDSPMAAFYKAETKQMEEIISQGKAGNIPEDLFVERIREGSQKKVPGLQLLNGLRADLENFLFLSAELRGIYGPIQSDPEAWKSALKKGGMILRSPVSRSSVTRFLNEIFISGIPLDRGLDALLSVAAVLTRHTLDEQTSESLASSLAKSRERQDRFSSLFSLFTRGRANGLSSMVTAEKTIQTLNSGGNFTSLDQLITKEGRR